MKHIIILFFATIIFSTSFGQQNRIGVFMPKDAASPNIWKTKHMWVGLKNYIASDYIGSDEFVKVWADNGIIDTGTYYSVTPLRAGEVTVYSIQKIYTGQIYDTVSTIDSFTAIIPPEIKVQIINENFFKDSIIQFILVDKKTGKQLPERYEVGLMYEPEIYNNQDNWLGIIPLCFGSTIEKSKFKSFTKGNKIKSGYKIKIRLTVRDTQTDLLRRADEMIYIFK